MCFYTCFLQWTNLRNVFAKNLSTITKTRSPPLTVAQKNSQIEKQRFSIEIPLVEWAIFKTRSPPLTIIYIFIHVYVCIYTYMNMCIYTYRYVCVHVCIFILLFQHMYIHTHTHIRINKIHTYVYTHASTSSQCIQVNVINCGYVDMCVYVCKI